MTRTVSRDPTGLISNGSLRPAMAAGPMSRVDDRHDNAAGQSGRPSGAPYETWDSGCLHINGEFSEILRRNGLTTFEAFFGFTGGQSVRRVGSRETVRFSLASPAGNVVLYLKRHGPPRWRDTIMPLLRFSMPIHGARNEWEAILKFQAAGIPTMTPVAFGEQGQRSLLVTVSLPARCNLLEWVEGRYGGEGAESRFNRTANDGSLVEGEALRTLMNQVAAIARQMHAAGLHHQDFYLNHLLDCGEHAGLHEVRVIDLGRVRRKLPLATRWIVKDLAQLDFSARRLPVRDRLRFLRLYLGRRLRRDDRSLIARIAFKSRRIAAHTAKHRL